MLRVLLIGSTGFVGRHIQEHVAAEVQLFVTSRQEAAAGDETIYFDFAKQETWLTIKKIAPAVIINAAGYGVVKEQTDLDSMYDINYRLPTKLIAYLAAENLLPFWLQIGTAFEYDLGIEKLSEESSCVPLTHYGISKYMCSNFLLSPENTLPCLILRPFAMFGPYESASKLLPYLILAQREKRGVPLTSGAQERDYFYVKDLARFISLLLKTGIHTVQDKIINVGSGKPTSLKSLATSLAEFIPDFQPDLWQWNSIPQRDNENTLFYNFSEKAKKFQFHLTPSGEAFQETVSYYFQ